MRGRSEDNRDPGVGVVVPLRSFVLGKARLATVLDDNARSELARTMAETVIAAAGALPLVVVSSAPEVRTWARDQDLELLADPGSLAGAATAGHQWARARELARVAIVHADLPRATSLATVTGDGADPVAVIVPDHRDDGTPVLVLPAASPFTFAYGPGSAARHIGEARTRGLDVRVVRDAELGFDVGLPADLANLPVPQ